MLVYRDHDEIVDGQAFLARCRREAAALAHEASGAAHDAATSLLIDVGMLEAALADRLQPERDGRSPAIERLRAASLAAGRLFHACLRGPELAPPARELVAALAAIEAPPGELALRTPEGYAWYALYPEAYAEAAARFAATAQPRRAVCLGLRSIGTSLSAVAAAALAATGWEVASATLRPRGHVFDRRPVADARLERWIARQAASWFLVIDEGPGLSGSSLAGTADWLESLGVLAERIVFLPGYRPDPDRLLDEKARWRWRRQAIHHVTTETALAGALPWRADAPELSGGAWRALLYAREEDWPAVRPGWERRKFLSAADDGRQALHRFAGLGRFGARARRRAEILAEAGFTAPVLGLKRGFLALTFLPGSPFRPRMADGALSSFAARYLGYLGRRFGTGRPARPEELVALIVTNAPEALGKPLPFEPERLLRHAAGLPPAEAVALDARVQAHEWLRTPAGLLKTDALDHHADHGWPGPADIAWDVAGFGIELGLDDAARRAFAEMVAAHLNDPGLPSRLPFYTVAYLACRVGQCADEGDDAEGRRLRAAGAGYRSELARSLLRLAAVI